MGLKQYQVDTLFEPCAGPSFLEAVPHGGVLFIPKEAFSKHHNMGFCSVSNVIPKNPFKVK
jgi:hypothetical protein